jgi:hypothetical protein
MEVFITMTVYSKAVILSLSKDLAFGLCSMHKILQSFFLRDDNGELSYQ